MLHDAEKQLVGSYIVVDLKTDCKFSLVMIKINTQCKIKSHRFTTPSSLLHTSPGFHILGPPKELGTEQHDKYSTVRATQAKSSQLYWYSPFPLSICSAHPNLMSPPALFLPAPRHCLPACDVKKGRGRDRDRDGERAVIVHLQCGLAGSLLSPSKKVISM